MFKTANQLRSKRIPNSFRQRTLDLNANTNRVDAVGERELPDGSKVKVTYLNTDFETARAAAQEIEEVGDFWIAHRMRGAGFMSAAPTPSVEQMRERELDFIAEDEDDWFFTE